MKRKLTFFFLVMLAISAYFQYHHDLNTNYVEEKNVFVSLPSGKALRILSFGFSDLTADLLFIWSVQFYSSYHYSNRYDYLERIYNTITDLAPRYSDVYIVGSWIMSLEAKDIDMAVRLLEKGSQNNPDKWIFDYEIAFYLYKYKKDYKKAEIYFKRAARHPGAPSVIKRQQAHMVYMSENLTQAWKMWMEIYETAGTAIDKESAYKHLFQIKLEIDRKQLYPYLQRYKRERGRYPANLGNLAATRWLTAIPLDFTGQPYFYNPETGEITARKMFTWKK